MKPALLLALASGAFLITFAVLAVFTLVWFAVVTNHEFATDFHIYYNAMLRAAAGENPYLPYSVGGGFVSHPLLLVLMKLFSFAGGSFRAMLLWIGLGVSAWVASIWVCWRLLAFEQSPRVLSRTSRSDFLFLLIPLMFLFGPALETAYQGQVNFLVVGLLLAVYLSTESGRDASGGFSLALAIALKTSPVVILPYFILLRRFRILLWAVLWMAALTALPALVFPDSVVAQYGYILGRLSRAIEPSFYNESVLSAAYRALDGRGIAQLGSRLIVSHKLLFALVHAGLFLLAWRRRWAAPQRRLWLFAGYSALAVISSPLVWYHHSVLFLLPLVVMLGQPGRVTKTLTYGSLILIQGQRWFEDNVWLAPVPVLVGQIILTVIPFWYALRASHEARGRENTRAVPKSGFSEKRHL